MNSETLSSSQLAQILIEAARAEEWEKIDNEMVPQLKSMDGSSMAKELLRYVEDEDPNVRDVVATSFAGLEGLDPTIETQVAEAMFKIAGEDEERYPAGRAIIYLLTLKGRPEFKDRVTKTLAGFKKRAKEMGWISDLKEAIPALTDVL